MAKVQILIIGKVQGVFFRQSARQEAKSLKLAGWIKNLPDGNVLSEAIGLEGSLLEYISWCKKGPPRAEVTNTIVEWLENQNDSFMHHPDKDFDIIS